MATSFPGVFGQEYRTLHSVNEKKCFTHSPTTNITITLNKVCCEILNPGLEYHITFWTWVQYFVYDTSTINTSSSYLHQWCYCTRFDQTQHRMEDFHNGCCLTNHDRVSHQLESRRYRFCNPSDASYFYYITVIFFLFFKYM